MDKRLSVTTARSDQRLTFCPVSVWYEFVCHWVVQTQRKLNMHLWGSTRELYQFTNLSILETVYDDRSMVHVWTETAIKCMRSHTWTSSWGQQVLLKVNLITFVIKKLNDYWDNNQVGYLPSKWWVSFICGCERQCVFIGAFIVIELLITSYNTTRTVNSKLCRGLETSKRMKHCYVRSR